MRELQVPVVRKAAIAALELVACLPSSAPGELPLQHVRTGGYVKNLCM